MIIDETFIHNLPFPACIKDTECKYVHVSKQYARHFFSKDDPRECAGLSIEDLSYGMSKLADKFLEGDKLVLQGNDVLLIESGIYGDGIPRVYIERKTPFRNKQEEIIGVFVYLNEVNSSMLNLTSSHMSHGLNEFLQTTPSIQKKKADLVEDLNITSKELDVLFFLSRGFSVKQVANIYENSPRTIESQVESIKQKLQCNTRDEVISNAFLLGINNRIPEILLRKTMAINVVLD